MQIKDIDQVCDRPGQITDNLADYWLHHYVAAPMLTVFPFSLC